VRSARLSTTPNASRTVRTLATAAATAMAVGVPLIAPADASADTAPGAPVISATTDPPAGTHSCPAPAAGSPSKLALGMVCSFTLSPNPADTSVPTGYQVSYPFNEGSPEDITAADPGNGNSFDAATGVATITIVVNDGFGTLTVNAVDAGNQAGPTTQQNISAQYPVNLGISATLGDYDGDGTSDLVVAPLSSSDLMANGLWFAKGSAGGVVSANAENLAANDNLGTTASGGPFPFTGAEVVPGDWCGTGDTSLLAYFPQGVGPDSGGGFIFCGDGDRNVVRNVSNFNGGEHNLSSGSLSDANGVNPTDLVDAGDLAQIHSGIPDLIAVIDNQLLLAPTAGAGAYSSDGGFGSALCGFSDCTLLTSTPSPDGTFDWNAWKLVGYPLSNGQIDMYLWKPATGELVLWTGITATDAANDGVWSNFTTLRYTQHVIASGTGTSAWNKGANLALQAADFNGDGVPDLWAVNTATATAVPYTARINGSVAGFASGAKQSLVTPAHEWELNDLASGSANQALDSGSDTDLTLRNDNAGATWRPCSPFGAAVSFDGKAGILETYSGTPTSGAALTVGSSFTLGAWVKPAGPGTVLSQQGTDDSSVFLSAVDGTWRFGINTAGTTAATYAEGSAGSWTAGAWTHVVLSYDASTGRLVLYINGDRADTVRVGAVTTVNGPFVLGANQAGGALTSYFHGELARVVTFDTALTGDEVKKLP
jgi:concanavalin A-like lectin/glucanase superfamily protein